MYYNILLYNIVSYSLMQYQSSWAALLHSEPYDGVAPHRPSSSQGHEQRGSGFARRRAGRWLRLWLQYPSPGKNQPGARLTQLALPLSLLCSSVRYYMI